MRRFDYANIFASPTQPQFLYLQYFPVMYLTLLIDVIYAIVTFFWSWVRIGSNIVLNLRTNLYTHNLLNFEIWIPKAFYSIASY